MGCGKQYQQWEVCGDENGNEDEWNGSKMPHLEAKCVEITSYCLYM